MNTNESARGAGSEELHIPELTLGWRLRMAIETAGLSSDELGEMLGVSGSAVRRWANGTRAPKRGMLLQTALICQVPAEWLITGKIPEAVVAEQLEADSEAGRSDNHSDTDWFPHRIKKTSTVAAAGKAA